MKGIIIDHTLVENFDGTDVHKKDVLAPNTPVEVLGHSVFYGNCYTKIRYGGKTKKIGFVDDKCIVEV